MIPKLSGEKLIYAFADLFDELGPPETPEEIDALLREAGLDSAQIGSEVTALIAAARAATPLDWRNRRQGEAGELMER